MTMILIGCDNATAPAPAGKQPSPSLSPEEVVRIQLEALKANDASDNGIAITFRFASPGNKMITGPVDRFSDMVKSPGYAPMLNFRSATFEPLETDGQFAQQLVEIVDTQGTHWLYLFRLSKQQEGNLAGCWMTDGVLPVELHDPPATQPATKPLVIPPVGVTLTFSAFLFIYYFTFAASRRAAPVPR
jgi:hypothetical protein